MPPSTVGFHTPSGARGPDKATRRHIVVEEESNYVLAGGEPSLWPDGDVLATPPPTLIHPLDKCKTCLQPV